MRDDNDPSGTNDNIARKNFILTIGIGENRYRVWNNMGTTLDFMIDGGICKNDIGNNAEITDPSGNQFFDPGETIGRYASAGTCATLQATYYYANAVSADTNCDFRVNISSIGFTDR